MKKSLEIRTLEVELNIKEFKFFMKKGFKPANKGFVKLLKSIVKILSKEGVISPEQAMMAKFALKECENNTDTIVNILTNDKVLEAVKEYIILLQDLEDLVFPDKKQLAEKIRLLREEEYFKESLLDLNTEERIEAIKTWKQGLKDKQERKRRLSQSEKEINELMKSINID